jgi:ABC-type amino acid transport substrate-binding protein
MEQLIMYALNVMKIVKYICCSVFLVLSFIANSSPQSACLNFHVIHSEPIGYINEKGSATGVHWEYLEALREHSGLCINIKLMPYARIWKSMESGGHDGGIIFKSKSRDKIVNYAGHIQTVPTVVIPLKGKKLYDYDDLQNLIIGSMRGIHLSKRFDNDKSLNLVELVSFEQSTRMVSLKRLDAIAGNAFALIYQIEKYGVLDKIDLYNQLKLGEKEQWLQFSHKSQHLTYLPTLQKSIVELKESGVFRSILYKYYGSLVTQNY